LSKESRERMSPNRIYEEIPKINVSSQSHKYYPHMGQSQNNMNNSITKTVNELSPNE